MREQDHLILLHHARRCSHDDAASGLRCPVYPDHCAAAKRMWRHIAACTSYKKGCTVCHSARHLLTHYRNCRDWKCPICGPVREVVRLEKERKQRRVEEESQRGKAIPYYIPRTDTSSTGMTTGATSVPGDLSPSPSHDHKSTIDEWVACRRLTIVDGQTDRRRASGQSNSGSMSSLSHSTRSRSSAGSAGAPGSANSDKGTANGSDKKCVHNVGGGEVYCIECQRLGALARQRLSQRCSSGIRCRNNPGIAHFCNKDGSSQK